MIMEGVEVQCLTSDNKEALLKTTSTDGKLHSLPKHQSVNLEFEDLSYNVVLNRRKNGKCKFLHDSCCVRTIC